jgi:dihydrofolate reductase|tara:strand:+ start:268 stop:747 length:480 start_codon:yes stop_codon:yes gene_type:complete
MSIVLIAALSKNNVIGRDGSIPWNLKKDLQFFKEKTINSSVIMGRSTFDSIGRPLPNRRNIVLTRKPIDRKGVIEVSNVSDACSHAKDYSDNVYIIGGENVYKEFIPMASKLILTEIEIEVTDGDTFFPQWDRLEWKEVNRSDQEEGGIRFSFVEYERY